MNRGSRPGKSNRRARGSRRCNKLWVYRIEEPVFRLGPAAAGQGGKAIAWFDTRTPLRSGWAWGQHYLENGVVAIEAAMGKGRVLLFGPEILKRAQPHGTFKFLFNGIYLSVATRG